MIRWMCGISMKDRGTNEELRRLVGVEPITTVIRSGRLRWSGHVMRKGDEDWVKKCMEFRVEGHGCCCLPTPMTLASERDSDVPVYGPPARFSVHLASSAVTPAGSVHKSRGGNVGRMWVQLKR